MFHPCSRINVSRVRYPVTREALLQSGMHQINDESALFVWWDGFISKEQFLSILPHQRVNKLPGMDVLCYKSSTFKAFNHMRAIYPKVFTFYPLTYLLPYQFAEFQKEHIRLAAGSKVPITWIYKPRAGCSGNGIKLIQNSFKVADNSYSGVIQKYISPYLLDGYKFDFRLYVFIPTVSPFTVYIYKEGLARFCTDKYEPPTKANLSDRFCHLSNTSVNIGNKEAHVDFCQLASSVIERIRKFDVRGKPLWAKIKYVIMLSMVAQYPQIMDQIDLCENEYRLRNPSYTNPRSSLHSNEELESLSETKSETKSETVTITDNKTKTETEKKSNTSIKKNTTLIPFEKKFFHILGLDIMLNDQCEPVVLEMNDRPSMLVTFDLEKDLKMKLNLDALKMVTEDGSPPPAGCPTGGWEKIMPIDETTQLGMAIKNIMDKSLQTMRNISTVTKPYSRTTQRAVTAKQGYKAEQSMLPPLRNNRIE